MVKEQQKKSIFEELGVTYIEFNKKGQIKFIGGSCKARDLKQ